MRLRRQKIRQFLTGALCVSGLVVATNTYADSSNITRQTVDYTQGQINVSNNAFNTLSYAMAEESSSERNHITQRLMMLKSIALRVGQQYGYAKQLEHLQHQINNKSASLDQIFNFNFILSYANYNRPAINILPPVILKANRYIDQSNQRGIDTISISDVHYSIYSNARFVTTVPSWRDYLIKEIPAPEVVSDRILPKDANESLAWQSNLKLGWKLGIQQANQEMEYRINQLSRDYNGMILYLKLYKQGKVNAPDVAYMKQSVVGDNDSMSVNQQIYRLTAQSTLVTNPNQWKFTPQKTLAEVNNAK
ncbi:type IV secretory system conjugative DNA transfer family protein [Fangia hongkongensis]|uniref:type IV secretory system conjugative DNA transfer family protein n=1 Tax=Fangia hongkongensis TaxID=270495 RepID=UPI00037B2F12|nr:type IV secretory system conjugative DNA transfer family protein [Fangia hongkongensis]MBK2125657.1 type IV secretory system conjugative DNA transfer family protein [Fangia hongkongensis]